MEHITLGNGSSQLNQTPSAPREAPRKNASQPAPQPMPAQTSPSVNATPEVTFDVDTDSGRIYIHVVDPESGEIVREIPPEALRRLAEAMDQISGTLVNTSA